MHLNPYSTPTPKKLKKPPQKRLMDFPDGINFQRFELEGWDLVHGSEILKKMGPPQPPKNAPKPPKTLRIYMN